MTTENGRNMSIQDTLPEVVADFEDAMRSGTYSAINGTLNPTNREDWFGSTAISSFNTLFFAASRYLTSRNVANTKELMKTYAIGEVGISLSAIFAEVAALKLVSGRPNDEVTSKQAGDVARNGYEFIEAILDSGNTVAPQIVEHYLLGPDRNDPLNQYKGSVFGVTLVRPDRLEMFELVESDFDHSTFVRPKGFATAVEKIESELTPEERPSIVNCPAHIFWNNNTGYSFSRKIYDVMIDHIERTVYPLYLPLARLALGIDNLGLG